MELENPTYNWLSLSWEQLLEVHQMMRKGDTSLSVDDLDLSEGMTLDRRLEIFLYLQGWALKGQSYQMPQIERIEKMTDEQIIAKLRKGWDITPVITEMQNIIDGTQEKDITLIDKEGSLLSISRDNLLGAAYAFTQWLEDTTTLVALPIRTLVLNGTDTYTLPSALFQDLDYHRYSLAEMSLSTISRTTTWAREAIRRVTAGEMSEQEGTELLKEYDRSIRDAQNRFTGIMIKAEDGTIIPEHIATTLYTILLQYFQSCLHHWAGQYPRLFKSGDGDTDESKKTPLTQLMQTVTSLIKYTGTYPNTESLLQETMPAVFAWLDMQNREAEENKRIADKAKRQKHH